MKIKFFSVVILLITICSCTKTTKPDFLYLNASQLKPLGIELNNKGMFYKNENPDWKQDHEKYACLAFYCTNDNYLTSTHFNAADTLKAKNGADSIIAAKELTKNNFYPLLIGNNKGIMSLDNGNLPVDMKLLPIAVCMAETNLPNRKDTIIVWLRPTESLKKVLPGNINMDEYLKTRPARK